MTKSIIQFANALRAGIMVTDISIFCIGGVELDNLPDLVEADARCVVIVSEILQVQNPGNYLRTVKSLLKL